MNQDSVSAAIILKPVTGTVIQNRIIYQDAVFPKSCLPNFSTKKSFLDATTFVLILDRDTLFMQTVFWFNQSFFHIYIKT